MAWKWFGVKTLYRITAEGKPRAMDGRFVPDIDLIEERVVLVKARNSEEAHRKAAEEARGYAGDWHTNPYGQQVCCRLIDHQVAFECFDEPGAGAEVFSDVFVMPKSVKDEDLVVMRLDTEDPIEDDRRTIFLNEEFSGRVE
ncbi:MAG: DUF4288 domain-containing protein [Planctomycetota bacterium]|jgi:hypothetical protein